MKYQILVFLWGGGHIIATSKKADCWTMRTAKKHKAKLLSTDKYKSINMNFNDWADSFGYDSDSIRALGVYNACCENAKQMHRIFSRESIEKLSELLQEY